MKRFLVLTLLAASLVTADAGEVEAAPYNCSMSPSYTPTPDNAFGWCLNGWIAGDRARLMLTCRNKEGQQTTSGYSSNVISNANQVSTDYCSKTHPFIASGIMVRWSIA